MGEYLIQSETLTALGDKIRNITGRSEQMTPAQMVSALDNITGGLSGSKDRIEGYRDSDKTVEQVIEISPPVITDVNDFYNSYSFWSYKNLSLPLLESISSSSLNGSDIESVDLPTCSDIYDRAFNNCNLLSSVNIPICQVIGDYGFAECESLTTINLPVCTSLGHYAFQNCSALEVIYLNSACVIGDYTFDGVLDPDNKTFQMHFSGESLPSDYGYYGGRKLFGELSSQDSSGSGSGSESGEQGISDQPIPGLEIYVPANMLDEFRTSWCGGFYANNIFAEPAVDV